MFGEKLMKLRKENALTQEELAEKLGVTRQTISKWELGQTVPDKDKLIDMAKIFNVTVDELLNEKKEERTMENNNAVKSESDDRRKKIIIGVAIGIGVLLLIWLGYFLLFGKVFSSALNFIGNVSDKDTNSINKFVENGFNIGNEIVQNAEKEEKNYKYEHIYSGIKDITILKNAINEVIANNMKSEDKIAVKYNETSAVTSEELASLVATLNNKQYLITYNYDENGFINEMNISDVEETKTSEEEKVDEVINTIEEQRKKQQELIEQKQNEVQQQIDSIRQKVNAGL